MKTLFILRHAKSSWSHSGLADHDRPLNRRGKRDAPKMGELLSELGLVPDLIISSTAKRAHATAKMVAEACGYGSSIRLARDFYHADPEDFIEVLQGIDDEYSSVMIVGHNPGMEELLDDLTGESAYLTTANIAHVELPIGRWSELDEEVEGKLVDLWRPKEI